MRRYYESEKKAVGKQSKDGMKLSCETELDLSI